MLVLALIEQLLRVVSQSVYICQRATFQARFDSLGLIQRVNWLVVTSDWNITDSLGTRAYSSLVLIEVKSFAGSTWVSEARRHDLAIVWISLSHQILLVQRVLVSTHLSLVLRALHGTVHPMFLCRT